MSSEDLKLPVVQEIKKELLDSQVKTEELEAQAEGFVKELLELKPQDFQQKEKGKSAVENMGADLQKQAARQSSLLRQPIKKISQGAEDGGLVGRSLIDLKIKVEELDPGKFDFEPGWFGRLVGRLPGIGTPLKRYFSKFESGQTVIAAIVRSLEQGRDELLRDNVTLTEDQKQMREMTFKLERAVKLAQMMDQKLEYHLARMPMDEPGAVEKKAFIQEELLFPLRQRTLDLQQQLAVHQQGVLATEIIIRNNKELVRGVGRSLNVTVTALEVGATVAMALANQKIVLDKIDSVNKTTSDLIAGTAARLKTQGVAIQAQASSAQLNMQSLQSAFRDINQALQDLSTFRQKALPQMAQTVLELDRLTSDSEKSIQKLEKGNQSKPEFKIEVR